MALTNAFFEAVSSRNIRRIRIMMKDSLLVDPSFSEFHKMENEASGVINLYDIHDEGELLLDNSLWNDSYMNDLMVQVVINFSHERIEHLQQVVRFLRPLTTKKQETYNQNSTGNYKEDRAQNQENRNTFNFSYMGRGSKISCGAIIGGVFGGSIASAISASVISGLVIGAALGAIVVTVSTMENDK